MLPVEILQKLLSVNKNAAQIVISGMAVVAAAAIISAWRIDFQTAAIVGIIIVALGVILIFLSFIMSNQRLKKFIGWITTVFIFLIMITIFISAAVPGRTPITPVPCLVRFWENCETTGDMVANRNAPPRTPSVPASAAVPAAPNVPDLLTEAAGSLASTASRTPASIDAEPSSLNPSDYRVYVQFAGFKREDIVALSKIMNDLGWDVQDADRGGERTANAAGLNEVRYHELDEKEAAEELAKLITETGITRVAVKTRKLTIIKKDTLEIWISL